MKHLFILSLIFSIPGLTLGQGTLPWQAHGPTGTIHADASYVVDPSSPETSWYSVRSGGIYHTDDRGKTERRLPYTGLGSLTIKDIAVAHNKPNTLVVITGGHDIRTGQNGGLNGEMRINGTGVYRSDNKGQTWTMLPLQLEEDDLFVPEDVLIGPEGNVIFIATRFRIMRSEDGGQNWISVYRIPLQDSGQLWASTRFNAHPENLDHVAITLTGHGGYRDGSQVHVSNDGGKIWQGRQVEGVEEGVISRQQILFANSQPGVVWLRDGTVFNRSTNFGKTFTQIETSNPAVLDFHEITPMHVHPTRTNQIILWGSLTAMYADDVLTLPDESPTPRHVRHILPAPGTYTGFRTLYTDALGGVWLEEQNADRTVSVSQVAVLESGRFLYSCFMGGRDDMGYHAYSPDQGFLHHNGGTQEGDPWQAGILQGTLETVQLLCPSDAMPIARVGMGLYRKTSQTPYGAWSRIQAGAESMVHAITSPEGTSLIVYASTSNGISKSMDAGQNWTIVSTTETPQQIHAASEQVVYSPTKVSKDGGMTWMDTPMESKGRMEAHPTDPSELWGCGSKELVRYRQYRTERELLASAEETGRCRDLLIFPQNPDWIWMGTDRGLWESRDAGETWMMKDDGLGPVAVMSVHLTRNQNTVAISTWGRGLWTVEVEDVMNAPTFTERKREIPETFALHGNYPNPFNPSTMIAFSTSAKVHLQLDIYDLMGRRLETLIDREYDTGSHRVMWDASEQASGIYLARLRADGKQVGTQKLILAR